MFNEATFEDEVAERVWHHISFQFIMVVGLIDQIHEVRDPAVIISENDDLSFAVESGDNDQQTDEAVSVWHSLPIEFDREHEFGVEIWGNQSEHQINLSFLKIWFSTFSQAHT